MSKLGRSRSRVTAPWEVRYIPNRKPNRYAITFINYKNNLTYKYKDMQHAHRAQKDYESDYQQIWLVNNSMKWEQYDVLKFKTFADTKFYDSVINVDTKNANTWYPHIQMLTLLGQNVEKAFKCCVQKLLSLMDSLWRLTSQ